MPIMLFARYSVGKHLSRKHNASIHKGGVQTTSSISFPIGRIPKNGVVIEFPDNNLRVAGRLARDLQVAVDNAFVDEGAKAKTSIEKVDEKAQDVGTILAVVLGTKAVVALAAGIAAWMRRTNQGRIRIRKPDGSEVDITNANSGDMAAIVKAFE